MVALAKRSSAGSHRTSVTLILLFLYGMMNAVLSHPVTLILGYGKDGTETIIHDFTKNAANGQHFYELATKSSWETTMLQYNSYPCCPEVYH